MRARRRARLAAALCLVAFGLATVVVPFLHERVHEHEARVERGAPIAGHDGDEDLHHRGRPHHHDRAHGDPHERAATRPLEPREHHQHHHHDGDDSDPLQHGADAPEHLGVALLVARPALPLPAPRAALQPAPPLARAGRLPRTLTRPNATRGPPQPGGPISIAAS